MTRTIEKGSMHRRSLPSLEPPTYRGLLILVVFFGVTLSAHCCHGQSNQSEDKSTTESDLDFFESKIRPLLVERCFECHAQSSDASGGLLLDSRSEMVRGGDSGPAIDLENPDASLLLRAIGYRDPKLQMPPDAKLSEVQVENLRRWIASGATAPEAFSQSNQNRPASTALTVARARDHWAYRPINKPPIPNVRPLNASEDPPESPIDAFLLRLQRATDVPASDRVDFSTWLRRLSIDLHGMNPTFDELKYWATLYEASDASGRMLLRERLIDSMLASPRYGERFARHWMDVVRYAESLTLRGFLLGDAWRYRNYLIEAFNSDIPFDQFVSEQIAGDLLPADNVADAQRHWSATTGLVLGDHNYEEQDKLQLEMDIIDEQLDTLGKAFLAQTIGCARCHDHKFDPIPTRDYYALAGILKSSVSVEHENVSKWIRMPLPLDDASEQKYLIASERRRELEESLTAIRKTLDTAPQGDRIASGTEYAGIVIDDASARKIGTWQTSTSVPEYINSGYLHDSNQGRGEKTVTFEPNNLAPGNHVVRIAYAHGDNRSRKTLVRIASADGETDIRVDQQKPAADDGLWQTLGTFRFEPGGQAFVIVSNDGSDGHVIADAIQFLPEGVPPKVVDTNPVDDVAAQASEHAAKIEMELLQKELKSVVQLLESRPMVQTLKAIVDPTDLPIHVRGSVHRLGSVVPRGFLSCINAHEPDLMERTNIPSRGNGRLELARWLVDDANPLTRRVAVNRIWFHLLGQGIVRSLDNFGTTGDRPSDPELLDWLAIEFRRSGGSTKHLVKAIATSGAYQRSVHAWEQALEHDQENRSFAIGNLRRLDAESLRDSILQASGELDLAAQVQSTIGQSAKDDYRYEHRGGLRSVYQPWFRNSLPELIREFDGANPSFPMALRDRSTVATQALTLMNSPWIQSRSEAASQSIEDCDSSHEAIRKAFRNTVARDPSSEELEWAEQLLREDSIAALVKLLFASIDFRYAP